MIHLRFALLLLICWAGIAPSFAQLKFSSLQEVFNYADNHAISILNAKSEQQLAASRNTASKTALLPGLNASAGFNDNITLQPTLVPANLFNPAAPAGTFNEYTFGRKYLYSTGAQLSWDVISFQKWFEIKTTGAALQLSAAAMQNARFQVFNQLAQTYYSILLTEKYILIARENVIACDSISRVARDKYQQGIFTEENVNRSYIQLSQATQQAADLSSSLAQLYNQLQSQLNTAEPLVITDSLIAEISDIPREDSIASLHPQVRLEQAQLELDRQQLAQTRSMLYPSLTLGYQYNRSWASDKMFDLSAANNLPQQFWGVKLSVPVFNGFSVREKVNQSKIQFRQQQQVLENQQLTARKEDENLIIQFRQSLQDLQRQEQILTLQRSNDLHSKDRYESGIIGIDERLDKFRDLLEVQNQYMQTLSNYYINYYKHYIRTKL